MFTWKKRYVEMCQKVMEHKVLLYIYVYTGVNDHPYVGVGSLKKQYSTQKLNYRTSNVCKSLYLGQSSFFPLINSAYNYNLYIKDNCS